jgi:aminopeptidase-like protein
MAGRTGGQYSQQRKVIEVFYSHVNEKNVKPNFENYGHIMHQLMTELFPICRSITGNGVRETLRIIQKHVPITIHEVPSGTKVFDWTVPREWNIRDAYILDEQGNKIVDFKENNLHVISYSIPVDKTVSLAELQEHLYSLEDQPDAIPYITSYYEERWGFCLSHNQRSKLAEGTYRVFIDSDLKEGFLTYGELIVPGSLEKEVFLSTYICHPSMANNELSGPVVTTFLAKWIASRSHRFTYRIVFIPETIGSITYLSKNLVYMKQNVVAGFNITCLGDERSYSFLPSRNGMTLSDKAALNILSFQHPDFIRYSYLDRGSDERQYCSPGIDLPVVSLMRSKYREYPEYHTSLDNLAFVTPAGLQGGYTVLRDCIELLERNRIYCATCLGEPQLSKRGLFPTISSKDSYQLITNMMNLIAYADGTKDLIDISNIIQVPAWRLYPIIDKLVDAELLREEFRLN